MQCIRSYIHFLLFPLFSPGTTIFLPASCSPSPPLLLLKNITHWVGLVLPTYTWVCSHSLEHGQVVSSGHTPKAKWVYILQQLLTGHRASGMDGTSSVPPHSWWNFEWLDLVPLSTVAVSSWVQWPCDVQMKAFHSTPPHLVVFLLSNLVFMDRVSYLPRARKVGWAGWSMSLENQPIWISSILGLHVLTMPNKFATQAP